MIWLRVGLAALLLCLSTAAHAGITDEFLRHDGTWANPATSSSPWISLNSYTPDCTGATNSDTALTNAFAAGNVVVVAPACTLKLGANFTVTTGQTLIIPCGSSISPAAATTLTFNGRIAVFGLCQVFGTAHALPAGTVAGVMDAKPEYWGAYNDNTHDDSTFVQQAANNAAYAGVSDYSRGTLTFSCGPGYRVGSTISITLPVQHFVEIAGCGMNPSGNATAGGIIVNDAGNTVNGLYLSGGSTNFQIHDLHIRPTTNGKGACGISLQNITTNAAAIVSSEIRRVQIGLNGNTGFGSGGICMTDVLEVGVFDTTVYMGGTYGMFLVTDTTGPSGDMQWDHLTVVNQLGAPGASDYALFFQTTAGTCTAAGGNCWVQGMHITHSFIYPGASTHAVYMNARGTMEVNDFWFDGVQYDSLAATNGYVYYMPTDAGATINNVQIIHNYFTRASGGGNSLIYDAGGSGSVNYLLFMGNYVNTWTYCSGGIPVISLNTGINHRIIGNTFLIQCGSTGGDIVIGGGTQKVTSFVVADNTNNCAGTNSTTICASASSFFIQMGANAFGGNVYNNACYYGNSSVTGCVTSAGTSVNHGNNCNTSACN